MKKNVMMRLASFLLVAVLISTSAISGTYAKYVTEGSASDTARVAKFGVEVSVSADAFATEYDADTTVTDVSGTAIAKTVVSSTTDKLVAPGTKGTLGVTGVTGTPEVAVNIKREVTKLALTGWEVDGVYYCPLTITVGSTDICGVDYTSADAFANAVKTAINSDANFAPNTPLDDACDLNISWAWAFENGKGQDNVKDTALGDAAANGNAAKIEFEMKVTVTQID